MPHETDWQRRLFVYGTLSPEHAPDEIQPLVARLKLLGPATFPGKLYAFDDYPGVVRDLSGKAIVHGALYELPDDPLVLVAIDDYELYDAGNRRASLFLREPVQVDLNGQPVACWAYLYNQSVAGAQLVPSGDYRAWRAAH